MLVLIDMWNSSVGADRYVELELCEIRNWA